MDRVRIIPITGKVDRFVRRGGTTFEHAVTIRPTSGWSGRLAWVVSLELMGGDGDAVLRDTIALHPMGSRELAHAKATEAARYWGLSALAPCEAGDWICLWTPEEEEDERDARNA
jgi:hypothetical protein